jgi:hypothetical protein
MRIRVGVRRRLRMQGTRVQRVEIRVGGRREDFLKMGKIIEEGRRR